MGIGGIAVTREVPVQFRYEGAGLVGEKRMELNVVPAFARRGVAKDCRGAPARGIRRRGASHGPASCG